MPNSIKINRAPVLTLWAAVMAEQLGFDRPTALTLGQAVARLSAEAVPSRIRCRASLALGDDGASRQGTIAARDLGL
jgi:hypothetical protein